MPKYFYRYVITILTLSLLGLEAKNINPISSSDLNASLQKNKQFFSNFDEVTKISMDKYGASLYTADALKKQSKNEKPMPYMFYFFSESLSFSTIGNLIPQFRKYKTIHPETTIYIVFNGFPSKEFMKKLREEYKDELAGLFKIKIHPPMYRYFELSNVPAYALANCPKDFRFKQCRLEDAIVVRGNISVADFYEVLSSHKNEYKPTYNKLIKAKE